MIRLIFAVIFSLVISSNLFAQEKFLMNKGWSFKYVGPNDKELKSVLNNYFVINGQSSAIEWMKDPLMQISYNDSSWRKINVPHDFVLENPPVKLPKDTNFTMPVEFKGFLERGVGLYRKVFELSPTDKGKRIWINFEGVFRDSQIFLNGFKILSHKSGYTPFRVDVTDFLHCGTSKNILLVAVDSRQSEGWWYEGGGIYRSVYLEKSGGSLYFEPDGVAVNPILTPDYSAADIEVHYSIQNWERKKRNFKIISRITDVLGKEIKSSSETFTIDAWAKLDCKTKVNITAPKLWSLEEPNLYFTESEILENDVLLEKTKTRFGIRHIFFDAEKGFFLNGKHVKIMGASVHQDNGSVGIAVPDEIMRQRVQTMKQYGFNGYRSAHHAAAPSLLKICDEEGILVVNEQRIIESSARYLEEMNEIILSSRNHPSVFLYSLANEENRIIDTDFEEGLATSFMKEIAQNDPQKRPATMNRVFFRPDERDKDGEIIKKSKDEYERRVRSGAGKVLDVSGFSYSEDEMYYFKNNGKPIIQTESYSGNQSTRGIYETDSTKFWISSIPDWKAYDRIKNFITTDRISGTFVWTAFDYRGEPHPYTIYPGISSHYGLLDLCGFPKDIAYYYKAVQVKEPVLHLFPHWNWKGKEGQIIKVFTYTNLDEVELFQDGKSMGKQKVLPFENQSWDVKYKPGTLIAKGYKKGKLVVTDKVETAGEPYSIRVSANKNILKADGADAVTLKFEILDKKGIVCPNADNIVKFTLTGNGHILGVDNGNPANVNSPKLPQLRAFNGLCSAIIQASEESGIIEITAESEGLIKGNIIIKTIPAQIPRSLHTNSIVTDYMFFRKPFGWEFK